MGPWRFEAALKPGSRSGSRGGGRCAAGLCVCVWGAGGLAGLLRGTWCGAELKQRPPSTHTPLLPPLEAGGK